MSATAWGILAIVVIAFVVIRYSKFSSGPSSTGPTSGRVPPPPPSTPGDTDEYELVGESHYQLELAQLFGPKGERGLNVECGATLIPEPENPHDKNAVRCEISSLKVGYLGRSDAKDFSEYLRRKSLTSLQVAATVRGGWKNGKSEGSFGVIIEVPAELIS